MHVIFLCPIFLEQIVRTNQNIKDALGKYMNEQQEDWDVHLQAIVYGINTAKQVRNILRKPLTLYLGSMSSCFSITPLN